MYRTKSPRHFLWDPHIANRRNFQTTTVFKRGEAQTILAVCLPFSNVKAPRKNNRGDRARRYPSTNKNT